jgi:hypothetical protein
VLSSCGRCVALAGEKCVNLDGIPKHYCVVERLGAFIPRRHLASLVQGDHWRPDRAQAPSGFVYSEIARTAV